MRINITVFLLLIVNVSFSQIDKKEIAKLKNYSYFILKSYHTDKNWSIKYKLLNGYIQEEENYRDDEIKSIQKNIYDRNNNLTYQFLTFKNKFKENKIDTLTEKMFKYDSKNRLIEFKNILRLSFTGLTTDGVTTELYSDFDQKSNAKTINRSSGDNNYSYNKENREFDSKGNLIKEEKIELKYPKNNESPQILKTETNNYKYDNYNNVVEINRNFEPKKELPYTGLDGLTIYGIENFEYVYNEKGLWLKKYLVVDGKKKLLEERIFTK